MGCPDWPKCFGKWVPPTDQSQLPENYKEQYAHGGKIDVSFNVHKTWTEYINRLIGVLVGFAIFLVVVFAVPFLKAQPRIFYLSVLAFVLVGFQGWIGARVVASNLAPFMVTFHMLLALLLLCLLIYILVLVDTSVTTEVQNLHNGDVQYINKLFLLCFIASLIQIVLGTQVREQVDEIASQYDFKNRTLWVQKLGMLFTLHKTFAIVVTGINAWVIIEVYRKVHIRLLRDYSLLLGMLLVLELITGSVLSYFNLLNIAQPIHLLLACIIFGIQFYLVIQLYRVKQYKLKIPEQ